MAYTATVNRGIYQMSNRKKTTNAQPIDIAALRKKVSEQAEVNSPSQSAAPIELNPMARLVATQLSRENHSPAIVLGIIRAVEFFILLTIGIAIHLFAEPSPTSRLFEAVLFGATNATVAAILMSGVGSYHLRLLRWPSLVIARLLGVLILASLVATAVLFILNPHRPTPWIEIASLFTGGTIILVVLRYAIARAIRQWGRNGVMERRAVIVGGGQSAKDVIRSLEGQQDNDIRVCGIFDDRGSVRSPNVVAGYPKLGTFAELVEFARLTKLDMLIIALPITAEARILQLLRKLWVLPVDIRIASHSSDLRFRPRAYLGKTEMPMLDVFEKPIRDWDSVAKRIFDIVFAILAIALTWPIMLGAAIAVKLNSKGPVLFIQKRHGFNNDTIDVLKFRSMYTEQADLTAKKAVTKNDPRVTPVGRFIRKTSIDELPQLFNVLRGELSLVGPRPHAVHAQTGTIKYDVVVEHYFARHKVKPGVTGWAQINGLRGEIDNGEKIKNRTAFDLFYIENWSLWLDFKILVTTPISLIRSRNVY
jgi:Undecaprenyl-phosphate glucose phosphotransferase